MSLIQNLGTWRRTVDTKIPMAQAYFDQGLRLYYAFNHAESVRAFREAQRRDPSCLMCVWGEAIALGPNINAPMDSAGEQQALVAAKRGMAMISNASPTAYSARDVQWMRAVAVRYVSTTNSSRAIRDSAYAKAMANIAREFPRDVDALAIAAEAQMDLSPWTYWTRDGSPLPGTEQTLKWLEKGMSLSSSHPGACHFYIHAVEAAHPERAVSCAERLAANMPAAGHIVHMPAHIYIRVGRWADAIKANKHAIHADQEYFDGPHTSDAALYSAMYRSHNFNFLTLAAVMAGASKIAFESSNHVTEIVTPDVARAIPALEPMLAVPVQTLVTFGKWDAVLNTPMPPSDLRVATSHFWYARGIAFAATGRTQEARATVDSIRATAQTLSPGETRTTLDIAARMVDGEIALRTGDASRAVSIYTEAALLEDGLSYMEPPTWYQPVRHSLGKALLATGNAQAAEQVYLADLRRFPENGWSLMGLVQSLRAQNLKREARAVESRYLNAWRSADISISSSRP
ncbi:MAG: hypothetical protein ABI852_06770 [Gemmatimonadaceae bacterium]